jgi:hypothetical protein
MQIEQALTLVDIIFSIFYVIIVILVLAFIAFIIHGTIEQKKKWKDVIDRKY